jgi:Protein of unknown function (DUF1390).
MQVFYFRTKISQSFLTQFLFTFFSTDVPYAETIRDINTAFDLSCSCGYVTLINSSSSKHSKSRHSSMDALNVYTETDDSTNNLLSYDGENNSFNGLSSKTNCDNTIVTSSVHSLDGSAWMPLQLCFGIPLFDDDLNIKVTRKVIHFSFLLLNVMH